MFIQADRPLAMSVDSAQRALERALAGGGLVAESRTAVTDGIAFLMPVGPRGPRRPAKEVIVRFLPPERFGATITVPLRWEAVGPSGAVFPALDANLTLTATGPTTTNLSLAGSYRPPLGHLGVKLDHSLLFKVATATMNAFLREVADHLSAQDPAAAG